jgi:hypothetical protein
MADQMYAVSSLLRYAVSSLLRLTALVVVSAAGFGLAGSAITPAHASSGAAVAATSGGSTGAPGDTSNTSDSNTNSSSEGNTSPSDVDTGTSEGNTGTPEQPPPAKPEPPAPPPPPPFLGKVTTLIEGQAGNAREGRGYQYEILVHNLGPGTLSGAKLRVMLPGRYFIEDVGDRDRKLRSVVHREDENGLPRHWRVWRLADIAPGAEVKFTIYGHFSIRKRQSDDSFAATAAVVLPGGGRESNRDEVNVVRRRPNR